MHLMKVMMRIIVCIVLRQQLRMERRILFGSVWGHYQTPTGYKEGWDVLQKSSIALDKFQWSPQQRIAHIFNDGWLTGSFQKKVDGTSYMFYYKSPWGQNVVHELKMEQYGKTKSWVIIQQNKKTVTRSVNQHTKNPYAKPRYSFKRP